MHCSPEWLSIATWPIGLLHLPFLPRNTWWVRPHFSVNSVRSRLRKVLVLKICAAKFMKLSAWISYVVGKSNMRSWYWPFRSCNRCCNRARNRRGLVTWWCTRMTKGATWRGIKIDHSCPSISCLFSNDDATYKDTDCTCNNTHKLCRMHLVWKRVGSEENIIWARRSQQNTTTIKWFYTPKSGPTSSSSSKSPSSISLTNSFSLSRNFSASSAALLSLVGNLIAYG